MHWEGVHGFCAGSWGRKVTYSIVICCGPVFPRLETELTQIERQVYELEQHYLEETSETGNLVRGWTLLGR